VTDRAELALPFPMPTTPALARAYQDIADYLNGDDDVKRRIGSLAVVPRPWDPPTCTGRQLRTELWEWLEAVVTWLNTEYVWDLGTGVIPACWPRHPHLVHEIPVLADQRRRAALDLTSTSLEEWHRYGLPAFLERLRARTKSHCDEHHAAWPGRSRLARHSSEAARNIRHDAYHDDVTTCTDGALRWIEPGRSRLRIIDAETGRAINPETGELEDER